MVYCGNAIDNSRTIPHIVWSYQYVSAGVWKVCFWNTIL